jgi:hypothetical protein
MSLATIMLDHLAVARRAIEDGQEMVPTWRIETPEGALLVRTEFDTDNPAEREQTIALMSRFMAWKMATGFVLTTGTWLGAGLQQASDEALLTIGVSHHERLAVLQRIKRGDAVSFSEPIWVASYHVEECYVKMLPGKRTEVTAEEVADLSRIFGKDGKLPPERLS